MQASEALVLSPRPVSKRNLHAGGSSRGKIELGGEMVYEAKYDGTGFPIKNKVMVMDRPPLSRVKRSMAVCMVGELTICIELELSSG